MKTCVIFWYYSGFRGILWTCIQHIQNLRLIGGVTARLRHTVSSGRLEQIYESYYGHAKTRPSVAFIGQASPDLFRSPDQSAVLTLTTQGQCLTPTNQAAIEGRALEWL